MNAEPQPKSYMSYMSYIVTIGGGAGRSYPQPEMTESSPDRIIEDWAPGLSLCMILSRHDSVCLARWVHL
jgi:hypothetical protein